MPRPSIGDRAMTDAERQRRRRERLRRENPRPPAPSPSQSGQTHVIHSRLPVEFTLEQRVDEINLLCGKLSRLGAQTARLRWRVALELCDVQQRVQASGLAWEAWCPENINHNRRDIRKLLNRAENYLDAAASYPRT